MQSPNSCTRDGLMTRFLPGTGKKSTPSRFQCKQRDVGGIRLISSSDLAAPTLFRPEPMIHANLDLEPVGNSLTAPEGHQLHPPFRKPATTG